MRRLRAVLFDLDDTLIDRRASLVGYAPRFHRDFQERLQPTSVATVERQLLRADQGGYSQGRRPHTLVAELVWSRVPDAEELADHWQQHFPRYTVPRDGLADTLRSVRALGLRTGVVTNGAVADQAAKLERIPAREYLEAIVISESAGVDKPNARIFELALQELGVSADEAWFVGDHPLNDVVGAARAGLEPVWLRGSHRWPPAEPAPGRQIDALPELVKLLHEALAPEDAEPEPS